MLKVSVALTASRKPKEVVRKQIIYLSMPITFKFKLKIQNITFVNEVDNCEWTIASRAVPTLSPQTVSSRRFTTNVN